jgi:hypothetical protein
MTATSFYFAVISLALIKVASVILFSTPFLEYLLSLKAHVVFTHVGLAFSFFFLELVELVELLELLELLLLDLLLLLDEFELLLAAFATSAKQRSAMSIKINLKFIFQINLIKIFKFGS